MTAAAVELESFGLAYEHAGGRREILRDATVAIPAGRFYLLAGASGSGKSTLLKLLADLWESREPRPRTTGVIRVLGHPIRTHYPRALRRSVRAVLQDEGLFDELSPRANVELALVRSRRSRRLALALLSQAGLDPPPATVAELSGGMRKRLAVARALAGAPALLIFDEPTAGLDDASARDIAALIARMHDEAGGARTTIVISHDLDAFRGVADAVIRLDRDTLALQVGALDAPLSGAVAAPEERAASPQRSAGEHELRRALLAAADLATSFVGAITHAFPRHPREVAQTTLRCILEPVFFVVVGCATVGGLATLFALRNNPLEGAFVASVLTGTGKVLCAVLIPLLAGIFFTARVAAGAAARIGTMKRTNQVAALQVMDIHPADYLLVPLVWAASIALPVVTLSGIAATGVASCAASSIVAGVSPFGWAQAFFAAVERADLRFVLLKAVLSGFAVAVLVYHLATGPKRSGHDVGRAVNAAIVLGIYAVLAVHAVLTLVQFG